MARLWPETPRSIVQPPDALLGDLLRRAVHPQYILACGRDGDNPPLEDSRLGSVERLASDELRRLYAPGLIEAARSPGARVNAVCGSSRSAVMLARKRFWLIVGGLRRLLQASEVKV